MTRLAAALALLLPAIASAQWHPAAGPLRTRWTGTVTPTNAHREYPRPQMVRPRWMNLNGLWDYGLRPANMPDDLQAIDGKILVPFPIESSLSGVGRPLGAKVKVDYFKKAEIPRSWKGSRILLHFGAVDWDSKGYAGKIAFEH